MWARPEEDQQALREGPAPEMPGIRATWVRRRYFVQDGYLRPIQGSEVERYDPFHHYYWAGHTNSTGRSLYLDLVELDLDDVAAIESFTSRWGLLGLLQHSLVQVRHVLQIQLVGYEDAHYPHQVEETFERPGLGAEHFLVEKTKASRVLAADLREPSITGRPRWQFLPSALQQELITAGYADSQGTLSLPEDPAGEASLQALLDAYHARQYEAWLQGTRFPHGSVFVRGDEGQIEEAEKWAYYARFFPLGYPQRLTTGSPHPSQTHVQQSQRLMSFHAEWNGAYPLLSSATLWDALCEPLEAFRKAVREFQNLYELCTLVAGSEPLEHRFNIDQVDPEQQALIFRRMRLQSAFTQQLQHINPHLQSSPQRSWTWGWNFPSLLSAAYAMLFLDFVAENRKLRYCANQTCGRSFVTDRSDRRYCTPNCQNTQKIRDYRRRKEQDRISETPS